jgi:hypothetical protein
MFEDIAYITLDTLAGEMVRHTSPPPPELWQNPDIVVFCRVNVPPYEMSTPDSIPDEHDY